MVYDRLSPTMFQFAKQWMLVTGRSTCTPLAPHYPLLSQMDCTTYTYSVKSVQAEQPVDKDQSSNGSFYCVIA
ncbi:hypothetical protein BDV93DRAFT_527765 [Ceratobasidium sp. AG-I]|nr:hypothetical protein BDV93DRAFT_527765 [Ceratobasidium sp. AG-I]